MSNYILRYSRDARVKYISHLDFIRLFHRAARRAGLEMTYSQGFNPHPVMTVALPLSVGVTSDCEYMKIGFDKDYTDEYITNALNNSMPLGYKIMRSKRIEGKEIELTKIDSILYQVETETDSEFDPISFMDHKILEVIKKSKSGEKLSDIRPHIHDIRIISREGDMLSLEMLLSSGCVYNLKPDAVIKAMEKYAGFECRFCSIHRLKAFCEGKEPLPC